VEFAKIDPSDEAGVCEGNFFSRAPRELSDASLASAWRVCKKEERGCCIMPLVSASALSLSRRPALESIFCSVNNELHATHPVIACAGGEDN
jgi:hypothetical protein